MRRATLLLMTAMLATTPVLAEHQAPLEPVPDIPAPPGVVDESLEPQITITQRGEDRIEEYRIKGRLYLIKVTPPHGKPYFLIDVRGNGRLVRYDDLSPNFMVPMWVIFEF